MIKLSWANIFRHKKQSFLLGLTIVLCSALMIFSNAYNHAIQTNLTRTLIDSSTGDILIFSSLNNPAGISLGSPQNNLEFLNNKKELIKSLKTLFPDIVGITTKAYVSSMVSHKDRLDWVFIETFEANKGQNIFPEIKVKQGRYFNEEKPEVMIAEGARKFFNFKIGEAIIFFTQAADGSISAVKAQFVGLASGTPFQQWNVWMNQKGFNELMRLDNQTLSLALKFPKHTNLDQTAKSINTRFEQTGHEARAYTWKELGGSFEVLAVANRIIGYIGVVIILIIIIFSIVNNVNMNLYERQNEIGIMLAMGLSQKTIRHLFSLEIVFISFIFSVIGALAGLFFSLIIYNIGIPAYIGALKFLFGGDCLRPMLTISGIIVPVVSINLLVAVTAYYSIRKINRYKIIDLLYAD
ncbi:MAG: ABC-type transport system (lipoprotein release) permease component [Candidatus Saganbacteria bacterium]|uniref:ABC-type transport system (Lipoprotein release) permease component n=1 Tax=Candidatus Saganbacteria bacterium TaxID=2575572 RepID=A0A833P3C8_UNCSA|nr:MAG: ABC-type transport system (lipoprotein release) permease component [Candidatus Saganbacteria bacterium]